ncbi:MAG: MarC family protein [Syntrophorhabdales bacterium]|jgi:multiple antibiotic resistance protein
MSLPNVILDSGTFTFFVKSFVSLFVIVNAVGNAPIWATLLEKFDEDERRLIVKKAVLVGCATLLIVTLTGSFFFKLLGVQLYSFRIAGGMLLTIVSIEMLYGRRTSTETSADEEQHYAERDEISILPLAIPLLTGPGALTTGIVLFDTAGTPLNKAGLVLVIAAVYFLSYLILSRAGKVFKYLGKTGTRVATRIMGLMLLSVAVQFMIEGIGSAFLIFK